MTEFTFDPRIPPALVAVLALALLGSAAWSLHRSASRVPVRVRVVLLGLRALGVLALVVALLGPSAVTREEILVKAPVLLLADASGSMSLKDQPGQPSRRQQLVEWAKQNDAALQRLRARCDVQLFDFGRELAPVGAWGENAEERVTAVGDALSAALKRTRGRANAQIVLFTDGRSTYGSDPLRAAAHARDRGVRLHAVAVGDPRAAQLVDRRVHNLLCPSVAQVQAAVPIHAFVASSGEKGKSMKVTLKVDDKEVESRDLTADQDVFSTKLTFLYTPLESGEKKIKVSVDPAPNDFDAGNNSLTTIVRVTQKDLRILYIEGKLRWDYTFLRRALAQVPGAHFQTMNLFASSPSGPQAPTPELLKNFNVVIIGDVKAPALGDAFLAALDQAVRERETGLLWLAGPENLSGTSGYASTPMAAMLPFELEGSLPPQEKPSLVNITAQGLSHFAVALDKDYGQNMKAWKAMPKLEAVARVGNLKPGAITLANSDDSQPLLLSQTYGRGRVLAFLAETAWKWALESEESGERYRRFWHQAVLWLAKKEKNARRLWLDLPRFLYLVGDLVEITATYEDPPGSPVPDASIQVFVQGPSGGEPAQPAAYYGGAYHATLVPGQPGDYTVSVEAKHKGEDVGRASVRIHVIAPSAEFEQPAAAPEALLALATAAGGTSRPLGQTGGLLEHVEREAAPVRVEQVHRRTLWDRAWLILLFVAALGVEWGMRKVNRLL